MQVEVYVRTKAGGINFARIIEPRSPVVKKVELEPLQAEISLPAKVAAHIRRNSVDAKAKSEASWSKLFRRCFRKRNRTWKRQRDDKYRRTVLMA